MIKKERFVVIAKVIHTSGVMEELVYVGFEYYPSDEELKKVWINAVVKFEKVFFLKVEKQVRFN